MSTIPASQPVPESATWLPGIAWADGCLEGPGAGQAAAVERPDSVGISHLREVAGEAKGRRQPLADTHRCRGSPPGDCDSRSEREAAIRADLDAGNALVSVVVGVG